MTSKKRVGELLTAARKSGGFDLEEISATTKINSKYLKALEKGDYSLFSSPLHIKGFLKIYSSFLGLNEEEVLAFWRREYNCEKADKEAAKFPPKMVKETTFEIGPRFFAITAGTLLVLGFLSFLTVQYVKFSAPPKLMVSSPQGDLVTSENEINVFGIASADAVLSINGKNIILGEGGEFLMEMPLKEGINLINIIAKNRFEKEAKKTFKVVYEPPKLPPQPIVEPELEEESVD